MFVTHVRNIGGIKRTSMKQLLVACDSPGVAQQFSQPHLQSDHSFSKSADRLSKFTGKNSCFLSNLLFISVDFFQQILASICQHPPNVAESNPRGTCVNSPLCHFRNSFNQYGLFYQCQLADSAPCQQTILSSTVAR